MLKALVDGKLSYALPGIKGICPFCSNPVIARCGEINISHWAHENLSECDEWHEAEGWWHLNWKKEMSEMMPEVKVEQIIKRDTGLKEIVHIADMVINDTVVELQNSPISPYEIYKRETFYKNMIWIFNGTDLNYYLYSRNSSIPLSPSQLYKLQMDGNTIIRWVNFKIKWLKKSLLHCKSPIAIDVGESILRIQTLHEKGYGCCDVFPKRAFMQYLTKL